MYNHRIILIELLHGQYLLIPYIDHIKNGHNWISSPEGSIFKENLLIRDLRI